MGQLSIFGEVKNGAIHQNNIRNRSFLNLILLNLQWYGLIPDNLGSNSDDRLKKKITKNVTICVIHHYRCKKRENCYSMR